MSNTFTAVVNLCRDPEPLELGGKPCQKLRLADNSGSKNDTTFFGAIVSGRDGDIALQLRKGDEVVISGQLVSGNYKAKKAGKGIKKGDVIRTLDMPFARLVKVTRSPTFFSGEAVPVDAPEAAAADVGGSDVDPLDDDIPF